MLFTVNLLIDTLNEELLSTLIIMASRFTESNTGRKISCKIRLIGVDIQFLKDCKQNSV